MNFIRKNWQYVGSGLFVVLAIGLAFDHEYCLAAWRKGKA